MVGTSQRLVAIPFLVSKMLKATKSSIKPTLDYLGAMSPPPSSITYEYINLLGFPLGEGTHVLGILVSFKSSTMHAIQNTLNDFFAKQN